MGTCHITSKRIKSCAAATADLQHSLRDWGLKEEMRHSLLQENCQDRSSDRYTQELILWAQFLYLLISRKVLKFFMVQIVSHDWQKLHKTSRNSKINVCLIVYQNHIYTIFPPYLFGTVSQSYLRHCLLGCSYCPPKNLTHSSQVFKLPVSSGYLKE